MYINIIHLRNFSVLVLCLRINDSGLFAWISLNALSMTYCIMLLQNVCKNHQPGPTLRTDSTSENPGHVFINDL